MKRFNTITRVLHTCVIKSEIITGWISIAVFPSCIGLLIGIALGGTSLPFSLAKAIPRKSI